MTALYNRIGINYSASRGTDPRIADRLYAELKGASRIVNIGAGSGSYEPDGVELVAVEPSAQMIAQRVVGAYPAELAAAESLPFPDGSFSHAMTVLSMHHWSDRAKAFNEINRVATDKFVAISWDPTASPFWLTRDYFPEFHAEDLNKFPPLAEFHAHFDDVAISVLPIPDDCQDGFLAAFWKRPAAYLNPEVRQGISSFSKSTTLDAGLEKLAADLESGVWEERNASILESDEFDAGYRLITARTRSKPVV